MKTRLLLILIIVLCFYSCSKSKTPLKDSSTALDSIAALLTFKKNTNDKSLRLKKAMVLSEKENIDSLWFLAIGKLSDLEYKNEKYHSFKSLSRDYLKKAKILKDTINVAKANFNLGSFYFKTSVYDSAFYHFNRAKDLFITQNDSLQVGRNLLNIAIIQTNTGDYYGSEITSKEALDYLNFSNNKKYIIAVYNNLGILSKELKQYEEALHWYKKSMTLPKKSKEKITLLNNIGLVYRYQKQYNQAESYFNKALNHSKIDKYPSVKAMIVDNLGYIYFLKKNPKSLSLMGQALKVRKERNDILGIITSQLHIGEYYLHEADEKKAADYFKKALNLSEKIGDTKDRLKALSFLLGLTNGSKYFETYNKLNNANIEKERYYKHEFVRIKLKTKEKEKLNSILQQKNTAQALSVEKQKNRTYVLISIIIILLVLFSIGMFYFKQKQKMIQQEKAIAIQEKTIATLKARADEKDQLSIYLHEDISSAILGGLQLGNRLQKQDANEDWEKVLSFFENAYDKIRKVSQEISVQHFSLTPFDRKVQLLIRQVSFNADLNIDVLGLETIVWKSVPKEVKVAIYGILQEGLNNIQKHSQAFKVIITFSLIENRLSLSLQDNGIGYRKDKPSGVGLLHIQKRVQEMNGNFSIKNLTEETGTLLKIDVSQYW